MVETHKQLNRRISHNTVNSYARDMKYGVWKSGYDPIVINSEGQLENGQHRLMAVVKSQMPTEFYVITDADGAMETYDRGRPRTSKDSLMIRLQKNGEEASYITSKQAIARCIMYYGLGFYKPSDDTIYRFIVDYNDDLFTAISSVGAKSKSKSYHRSSVHVAVFCALQHGVPESVIYEFFKIAKTGFMEEQWQTSAIIYDRMLNEVLMNTAADKKYVIALTEMAIRDFEKQKKRKLRYKVDFENATFFKEFCEKIKKERDYL